MSELVVMISRRNRFLHVGRKADLIGHAHGDPAAPDPDEPVDWFDAQGRSLVPVVNRKLDVVRLRAESHGANKAEVLRRIQAVLRYAREAKAEDPSLPGDGPAPSIEGPLPAVLKRLHELQNEPDPEPSARADPRKNHSGGWFHNLMHKI